MTGEQSRGRPATDTEPDHHHALALEVHRLARGLSAA